MDAKILIVEDDPDTLNGLSIRLKASGYALLPPATSASSAKKLVASLLPDLIILDLGLPDGDGYTVLEELKSSPETDSIPVIVLTGRDSEGNQERSYAQGTFDFFQKPVRYEWLLVSIEKALSQRVARNIASREQGAESST
jgi:DNA-binding response OmpR family regulator